MLEFAFCFCVHYLFVFVLCLPLCIALCLPLYIALYFTLSLLYTLLYASLCACFCFVILVLLQDLLFIYMGMEDPFVLRLREKPLSLIKVDGQHF